jgi:hypothetical protein
MILRTAEFGGAEQTVHPKTNIEAELPFPEKA